MKSVKEIQCKETDLAMKKYQIAVLQMLKQPDSLDPFLVFALNILTCIWLFLLLKQWWTELDFSEPLRSSNHQNFYVAPVFIALFLFVSRSDRFSKHFQHKFCSVLYPSTAAVGVGISLLPCACHTARYILETVHYLVSALALFGLVLYAVAIAILRVSLANVERKRQTLKTMNPMFAVLIAMTLIVVLFNAIVVDNVVQLIV